MLKKINFGDEFYQKLKLLVLPITVQQFMLALVSATDAIMLGAVSQTSLSAVSLAGQIQFVLNLFISGISAGSGIMAAQYWGKQDAASIEEVIPIALRTNLIFSGMFTILAAVAPEMLMRIFTSDAALVESGAMYLQAVSLSYLLCGISQIYQFHGGGVKYYLQRSFYLRALWDSGTWDTRSRLRNRSCASGGTDLELH